MKKLGRGDALTLVVVVATIAIDQLTKTWALSNFQYQPRHVIWTLELVVAHNTGTAFSLMSGKGVGPIVALLAVVVIALVARTMRRTDSRLTSVAIGLVVGGALGNLIDRAFRGDHGFLQGAVVDWINFQWWPVFNVADAAIVGGAIMLAIVAVFTPEPVEASSDESTGESPDGSDESTATSSDEPET